MNLEILTTRTMERLGVRQLSITSSRIFGHSHPPALHSKETQILWSKEDLIAFRQDARYSLIANAIRGSFTAPLVYATAAIGVSWIVIFTGLVLLLHLLIVLVDTYRIGLAHDLEPRASQNSLPVPPKRSPAITFKTKGYFRPRQFESEPLYRALGLEFFRKIVVWFVEFTKLSREERARGEEVHYVENGSRAELFQFEATTRTSEAIHLICALWNVPALWLLTVTDSMWAIFALAMVALDCYLVLLQRYHRARVWAHILSLIERHETKHDSLGPEIIHSQVFE